MGHLLAIIKSSALVEDPSTLARKLACKVVQRLGLVYLPPRVATWRYDRGKRLLALNVAADTAAAAAAGGHTADAAASLAEEPEEYEIPDALEDILEALLTGLRDKDTIVR